MDAPADGAYAEWQHSAPFLYEKAIVKVFQDGPVSTCQWKDTQMRDKSKRYIVYSLITGTFNLDGKSNFLNIHTVRFPNEALANDSDATPEDFKYFEDIKDRIDVLKNIPHNGPITRWDLRKEQYAAKIHQQHSGYNGSFLSVDINKFYPNLAITSSSDTRIYLWDLRNMSRVLHLCAFHRMPSSIAKWNPNVPNIFASGGNDSLVVIWDLEKIGAEVSVKDSIDGPPEAIFLHSGHVSPCCDISWNPHEPFGIASVEREGMLHIWEPSSAVINPQLIDAEFMPKRN
ncbi:MAG: putative histone-binding protein RBBP4 [Streblomastix strix]|uniref:Putative histone-binding protein RBBP4 n=1 Tax=Streblomastix strix TaxID=222440 RepID=A0A5J4VH74_9EUKA|nr:MAG: putative histone-binding protein RBBP4 [Streblomastix strix]